MRYWTNDRQKKLSADIATENFMVRFHRSQERALVQLGHLSHFYKCDLEKKNAQCILRQNNGIT